jgi:hypothetical protein
MPDGLRREAGGAAMGEVVLDQAGDGGRLTLDNSYVGDEMQIEG